MTTKVKNCLTIGEKIKYIRTELGYTQQMLGDLCDTSKQTVHYWEKDYVEPSISDIAIICKLHGIDVPTFFTDYEHDSKSTLKTEKYDLSPFEIYFINMLKRLSTTQQQSFLAVHTRVLMKTHRHLQSRQLLQSAQSLTKQQFTK